MIEHPKQIFDSIIDQVFTLYRAFIIHGDLSAYNILFYQNEPWIIDFPQAIDFASRPSRHKVLRKGRPILLRDITNIVKFFEQHGIPAEAEALCNECMEQIGFNDCLDKKTFVR